MRYRGYYYDAETGFYYLQSRYYDPIVKRFLNADSYASTGQGFLGYNMFVYCGNNPISGSDPSGHSWFSWIMIVRKMVEKTKEEAERTKKEFEQRFESAFNKSLESCMIKACDWLSVTAETISPDNTWGDVSRGATYTGGALAIISLFVPGSEIVTFVSTGVALIGLYGQCAYDYGGEPHVQYIKYVLDCGGCYDWRRDPATGVWTGKAVGERHVFYWYQISTENGIKTVMEHKGCTIYYTTPAEKGIYMYDFDFNQPPISPFS